MTGAGLSGPRSSRIARLETFVLERPVAVPTGPSVLTYRSRTSVIVRIEDGDGIVGWGETYRRVGTARIIDEVSNLVVGADPQSANELIGAVMGATRDGCAISAIAIAVDDLRGRQLGVPVATLYGGARRSSVAAYASSGGYRDGLEPEAGWKDDIETALGEGFRACKVRIGRYPMARELAAMARLRADTPADVDLMADGNGAYSIPSAITVGRDLERLGFRWFEEPLIRFRDGLAYPGYEHLAVLDIPIAAGEGLETRGAFSAFLRRGCAAIVQPDVAICGGIREALFVAEVAALDGRLCVPHAWGGAIQIAATLQLLGLLPEGSEMPGRDSPLLELDRFENPMRTGLANLELDLSDGAVRIPASAGLGIEVDEDFVRGRSYAASSHAH